MELDIMEIPYLNRHYRLFWDTYSSKYAEHNDSSLLPLGVFKRIILVVEEDCMHLEGDRLFRIEKANLPGVPVPLDSVLRALPPHPAVIIELPVHMEVVWLVGSFQVRGSQP